MEDDLCVYSSISLYAGELFTHLDDCFVRIDSASELVTRGCVVPLKPFTLLNDPFTNRDRVRTYVAGDEVVYPWYSLVICFRRIILKSVSSPTTDFPICLILDYYITKHKPFHLSDVLFIPIDIMKECVIAANIEIACIHFRPFVLFALGWIMIIVDGFRRIVR
ncbi:uncharacterized protein BDW43DRAFT_70663 [Aspergillus alliaceus]|uniref:uncharacterized protein n=1 Tax=Petromyces alliaceus TaxID=209559 RepID=UPI0012A40367|nr:uncharacterized protein BDW43DRAFT_70663 [Aspergillus alliaceus]KAB8238881.1 hypothetical protein BDW43DRAFT_70663 [Aspergillus alliaceus]